MRSLRLASLAIIGSLVVISSLGAKPVPADDETILDRLDEQYQAAVKGNDVAGMDDILAPDFTLVVGRGAVFTKRDLIESARKREVTYERQEDTQRRVRLYGNTAVVTALLWEKGVRNGESFDKKLWFSDVYVRTPQGWKYVFGQASLPLP
ncbi:MAG: nuclear transport factor 2 family protein [bacterium]